MPRSGPAPSPAHPDAPTAGTPELARRCERLEAEVQDLRDLAARLMHRQEDERRVLARALHDGAGGSITAIRMAAHAAMSEDDPAQRRADLEDVLAQAADALEHVRELCARLRPPPLEAVGLEAALRWHVDRMEPHARARTDLRLAALPRRGSPEIEQACFRIAEEALANALAHSGADRITLTLDSTDDTLRLEVDDNGTGFDPEGASGAGLAAMRERARSLGGRLRLSAARGEGTHVLAVFPFR